MPACLQEAYKAYERRRLALNEKATAAAYAKGHKPVTLNQFFKPKTGQAAKAEEQEVMPASKEEKRIMTLAAIAARASRLWRQNGNSIRKPKAAIEG